MKNSREDIYAKINFLSFTVTTFYQMELIFTLITIL